MALTFAEERLFDCIDEAEPLLRQHWQAFARPHEGDKLRPDYIAYRQLERSGQIVLCTARRDGRLIGYATFILCHGLHNSEENYAHCDTLWLEPSERRGRVALRLVQFCETALRGRGVDDIRISARVGHPALGRLLAHLGYRPAETIYSKATTDGPSSFSDCLGGGEGRGHSRYSN